MTTSRIIRTLCSLALVLGALPALGGEGEFEANDAHEHGAPFFGEAKNVRNMEPIDNAVVKLQVQGTMRFVLVQTDSDGRFRKQGLGPDIDPDKIEVTCQKSGFRTIEVLRRRPSAAKDAPVEIECLLEKN